MLDAFNPTGQTRQMGGLRRDELEVIAADEAIGTALLDQTSASAQPDDYSIDPISI